MKRRDAVLSTGSGARGLRPNLRLAVSWPCTLGHLGRIFCVYMCLTAHNSWLVLRMKKGQGENGKEPSIVLGTERVLSG